MINDTICNILEYRASATPERIAFLFPAADNQSEQLTYRELRDGACGVAALLRKYCRPGDRAVLVVQPGRLFVETLFGCFAANVIAVPAYPPNRKNTETRFAHIVEHCSPVAVLTSRQLRPVVEAAATNHRNVRIIELDETPPATGSIDGGEPTSVALLQYTSGSTGTPKGVRISHANLMHNLHCIQDRFGHCQESRGVIWLPPYHDMGLVGGILQPVYAGFPTTLMTPLQFITSPFSWLKRITDDRATTSGGPNLAFELCLKSVTDAQLTELDLSSWQVCFSGSESVRVETINRFSERFSKCGFKRQAFLPCYGLAETTLMVSGNLRPEGPSISAKVSGSALERTLVSCGRVVDGMEVMVVDPIELQEVPEGQEGEIWVRGESVSAGYWGTEGNDRFNARLKTRSGTAYFRTGDIGFISNSELFVVGRAFNTVNVGGKKIHCEDIDRCIKDEIATISSFSTAIAEADYDNGHIRVIQEIPLTLRERIPEIGLRICSLVSHCFGVDVAEVAFVRKRSIPITTTGKICHREAAAKFAGGEISPIESYRPPALVTPTRNITATWLPDILSEISGAKIRDATLNLFELGLSSLQMVRAMHEVRRHTGVEVRYEDIVQYPTIEDLSRFVEGQRQDRSVGNRETTLL